MTWQIVFIYIEIVSSDTSPIFTHAMQSCTRHHLTMVHARTHAVSVFTLQLPILQVSRTAKLLVNFLLASLGVMSAAICLLCYKECKQTFFCSVLHVRMETALVSKEKLLKLFLHLNELSVQSWNERRSWLNSNSTQSLFPLVLLPMSVFLGICA